MGLSSIPSFGLGKISFLLVTLFFAVMVVLFSLYLKRSWMGFAFEAVADDEDTAKTLSVDVTSYKLVAFALGTGWAGLAGGLYTYFTRFIVPDDFGFITSITILSMVAVGGIGSIYGVLIGATLLTLMPEFFRFLSDYKLLMYGVLLFVVMRFVPDGLAGFFRIFFRRPRGKKEAGI